MHTQIFVNLPVKDLKRSVDFFGRLGYTFEPKYADENAPCMVVGESMFVMLVAESLFKSLITKEVADRQKTAQVIIALRADSRGKVDELVAKAVAAGAKTPLEPKDFGFMYQHGYEDLDGHLWEVFYMDPKGPPSA